MEYIILTKLITFILPRNWEMGPSESLLSFYSFFYNLLISINMFHINLCFLLTQLLYVEYT